MVARLRGKCLECGYWFNPGTRIYYNAGARRASACEGCGGELPDPEAHADAVGALEPHDIWDFSEV